MSDRDESRSTVSHAALYRSVIRAVAEGVVVHAEDGRIIEANPSAERILGISLAQMTGLSPLDPAWRLVREDGTPVAPEDIPSEITRRTGLPCKNHRLGVHRPSGELAWLSVSTEVASDSETPSDRRVVVATFTDITDHLAIQRALEAERAHLQRVIDLFPPDRELGERLWQSARREAMGEISAGLAHNFNNLLAAILPNIELAMKADPSTIPLLEDALQATQSASDLMSQLLAFTRNAPAAAASGPVDLTSLVRDTVRFCKRTFNSQIQLDVAITSEDINVLGRHSNLQQVVLNLCLNARDALKGRPRPLIKVELFAPNAIEAILRISDNGVGMSPDIARHLGEPFFTTKEPGQGTGLGLATVYGIVRECRGTIRCNTTPNIGTAFEISLPRTMDSAPVVQLSAPFQSLTGLVLIIDDERLVRSALRRQLNASGLETLEAEDGLAGIQMVTNATRRPDLILLDLSMPGLPGEEVLSELVRFRPRIPVIIVSGHRGPSIMLDGAAAVLRKPVDGTTLLDTVGRILKRA